MRAQKTTKRVYWTLVIVLAVGLLLTNPVRAAEAHSFGPDGLCLPGSDLSFMEDCAFLGPRAYLERMAEIGITFPPRPLLAQHPDKELSALPYLYARITRERAPLFNSLDAAVTGEPVYRNLETGFNYVTYIDAAEVDGKRYYMIDPGVWMQGFGFSRVATPNFQGLNFSRTPPNDFGWVLFTNDSLRTPGYQDQDFTGREYFRYDIVQIYAVETVGDQEWYRIGPEEWLEGRQIARVSPNPIPPRGVESNRWIEVNLKEQTLAVYEERTLVFATVIASGRPGSWTRPGLFQIYQKKPTELMTGAFTADRSDSYYLEDVPWTMYFDEARALHGTYWHNSYGVPQSRGCVNLSPGDSKWLFDWAKEGDWVYVWDPSGETPVKEDLYGPGGA